MSSGLPVWTDALSANTSPSLKRFLTAPSMCRRVSFLARAIGCVSASRCSWDDGDHGLYSMARHASRRWCRTLGSARAARGSQSFVAAIHRRVRTGLPIRAKRPDFTVAPEQKSGSRYPFALNSLSPPKSCGGASQTGGDLSRRERKSATHLSQSSTPPCTRRKRRPSPSVSVPRSALACCRRRRRRAQH
jgi:hypothetical protein